MTGQLNLFDWVEPTTSSAFFLWSTQYKKTISDKMLEQLLTKGKTGVLTFKNKVDKPYKAHLALELPLEQGKVKIVFAESNKKDTKKTLAKSYFMFYLLSIVNIIY